MRWEPPAQIPVVRRLAQRYNRRQREPRPSRMFLDLAKAVFLMLSISSLLEAALHAFFIPGTRFEERVFGAALYLVFAGSVCVFSGLVFAWPAPDNPDRDRRFFTTLPVRLFLWSSLGILALFLSSWYLGDLVQQASPFISDRSLQRF